MAKCGNISMNISAMSNVTTAQRRKRYSFDSPGLASEKAGNPGV